MSEIKVGDTGWIALSGGNFSGQHGVVTAISPCGHDILVKTQFCSIWVGAGNFVKVDPVIAFRNNHKYYEACLATAALIKRAQLEPEDPDCLSFWDAAEMIKDVMDEVLKDEDS